MPIIFDAYIAESCCFIGGLEKYTKVKIVIDEVVNSLHARKMLISDPLDEDLEKNDLWFV